MVAEIQEVASAFLVEQVEQFLHQVNERGEMNQPMEGQELCATLLGVKFAPLASSNVPRAEGENKMVAKHNWDGGSNYPENQALR